MQKTSRIKIVTVEKRKNASWKVNVDLQISYKCVVTATGHPRKAYLGTAEGNFSHLEIESMQMRHHYQNISWK